MDTWSVPPLRLSLNIDESCRFILYGEYKSLVCPHVIHRLWRDGFQAGECAALGRRYGAVYPQEHQ